MTKQGFISRPHFCTDEGVQLPGLYGSNWSDKGCEVVPAGGARLPAERRTTAAKDAAAKLHRDVETIKLTTKMDRLIELMTKRVKAQDAVPRQPLPGPFTGPTPTIGQMSDQYRREYERRAAQLCAEAKAAYDARNPHKKKQRG